jgi:hypothetical protein
MNLRYYSIHLYRLIFRKYYTLEGAEKEALVKKLKDLGIYK